MSERYLLVDANSIGHGANQSSARLKAGDQETQAIFGSVRTLRDIMIRHGYSKVIAIWDGRSWRKDEDTEYKANREATPELLAARASYHSQTPHIKYLYHTLGIAQASASNMEADDLAAIISARLAARGDYVRLVTRDKDWLQLVRPHVTWFDHKTGEEVTEKSFKDATDYDTPYQFAQSKALTGDRGDNVSGVGGIGPVKAKEIVTIYGNVEAFLRMDDPSIYWTGVFPKAVRAFHQDKEKIAKFIDNMRMMNLVTTDHLPPPKNMKLLAGQFSPERFRKKSVELGFHSIVSQVEKFMFPFQAPSGDTNVAC